MLALAFVGGLAGAAALGLSRAAHRPAADRVRRRILVGLGLLPLAFTGAATPVAVVALLLIAEGVGQGLLAVAYTDMVAARCRRAIAASPAAWRCSPAPSAT